MHKIRYNSYEPTINAEILQTDKASMLDEVIDYLKQLQAQVQLMSSTPRNMAPQMMMPLGMHQHIQMSLLARMGVGVGLGMGMGMFDMTALARAAAASATTHPNQMTTAPINIPFTPSGAFALPAAPANSVSPASATTSTTTNSIPFTNPYSAFLPQVSNLCLFQI